MKLFGYQTCTAQTKCVHNTDSEVIFLTAIHGPMSIKLQARGERWSFLIGSEYRCNDTCVIDIHMGQSIEFQPESIFMALNAICGVLYIKQLGRPRPTLRQNRDVWSR